MAEEGEAATALQLEFSFLEPTLAVPSSKLDADHYYADDLDGVTESLFGSGNMAYASLQALQTDEALKVNETGSAGEVSQNGAASAKIGPIGGPELAEASTKNEITTDTDRPFEENAQGGGDNAGSGDFSSSTVGSLGASQLSSDAGSFAPAGSGLSLTEGLSGSNGSNGQSGSGQNGTDGNDGNNGNDGSNGDNSCDPCGPLIEINLGDLNIDLGDTLEILDTTLIDLGETITILTVSITDVTYALNDIVNNLTNNNLLDLTEVANIVNNLTDNLTLTIANTLNEVGDISHDVSNIVQTVLNTDITKNLITTITELDTIDTIGDTLSQLGGAVQNLKTTLVQLNDIVNNLDLNDPSTSLTQTINILNDVTFNIVETLDIAVGDVLESIGIGDILDGGDASDGLISQTLDPVVEDVGNIVDDLTGGASEELTSTINETVDDLTNLADSLTGDLTDGLLGANNDNGGGLDSDITADLGLALLDSDLVDEPLEIALDPVEDLVGDVDLDIGLGTDLLGAGGETDNAAGDTDLTLETDIDLVDNVLGDLAAEIPLDPVEEIIGDVDLDVDLAANILGDIADPLVNDGEGGTGDDALLADIGNTLEEAVGDALSLLGVEDDSEIGGDILPEDIDTSWTESIIGDDTLGDVIGDLGGSIDDALPDPVGSVAEGLGAIEIVPVVHVGGLGGLFG